MGPENWMRKSGSGAGDRLSGTRAKATALVAVLQLTVVAPMLAQVAGVDSLIPAQPVGYVNDFAHLLQPEQAQQLETLLRQLQGATGAELAVVTLGSIGDQDEADVAREIGRRWRIGLKADIGDSRRNAGAVLLVVPRQNHQPGTGHVRIETGQGLEGIVTDAAAGQIRRDVMGPDLQREAYGPAIQKGAEALTSLIARGFGVTDSALTAYQPPANPGGETGGSLLPLLLFILFFLIVSGAFGGRRRRGGIYWGGPWIGGGWGGGGGFGGGGGGFGGFGGGGGFSGGGSGGRF
jgi:uncharacterized protein